MIIYSRWNCVHSTLQDILDHPVSEELYEPWLYRHRACQYHNKMRRLRFSNKWLAHRLKLFKTFTYPTVLSQTNQDFTWRGLIHKDSPDWFLQKLPYFPRMEVHLVNFDTEGAVVGKPSINIDTDDAISKYFIEQCKTVAFEGETVFSHGIKYRPYTNFWLNTTYDEAPFNMIQHPTHTVLDFLHGRSSLVKNVVYTEDPLWVQTIHEGNIANSLNPPFSKAKGGPTSVELSYIKKHFDIKYDNISKELCWDG